tara:strand:+ start:8783 stop:9352 length:570 start_codon:yes stop_codon:yes gene_type:complete
MPFLQIKNRLKNLCLLTIVLSVTVVADEIMLDNFESNPEQRWRYVSDQVMGGVSIGQVVYRQQGDVSYAHMTGTVSTENNGGFIQLRSSIAKGAAAQSTGVTLRVRGIPQKYYVHLRTRGTVLPWQYYQASFDIDKQWRTIKVPFSAFKRSGKWLNSAIDPSFIRSIGVVAFGRDHSADIQITEIGFYN